MPYDTVIDAWGPGPTPPSSGLSPDHAAFAEQADFGAQMDTDRKWGIALILAVAVAWFLIVRWEARTVEKVVDAGVDYVHRH